MRWIRKTFRIGSYLSKVWGNFGPLIASKFMWEETPFLPASIDVEPVNYCNFRCHHCQVTHWNKEKKSLTVESLATLLKQFPHLKNIKLQGMGEPLLNKHFFELVELCQDKGIKVSFTTNGSLCDEKLNERLAQIRDLDVVFSLDGATAKTFESIRIGSHFEQIKKNIRNLVNKRGDNKTISIRAWTTITNKNMAELTDIVRLAKNLGLDRITLQPFLTNWGKNEMGVINNPMRINMGSGSVKEKMCEAEELAEEIGIECSINTSDSYSSKKKCIFPWRGGYIASNGDVLPCCILADSNTEKMGNIFENDFSVIWNSKKYQDLRRRIKTGAIPDYCKGCYTSNFL